MRRSGLAIAFVAVLLAPLAALADVIGSNTPFQPLSAERIATLPKDSQPAWSAYLARSQAQMLADRAALAAELKPGQAPLSPPPDREGHDNMPLNRDAAWYGSAEALAVADNIVSFQTPAGGWGKNQDRAGPRRLPGQPYAIGEAPAATPGNFDAARDISWHYVGTIDNGATTTEMRFLARVSSQLRGAKGDVYRASLLRGVTYLLNAQYPNGGWPQVWPLEGGYHDAVTFNDNALADVAMLMGDIGAGKGDYAFVAADVRAKASAASRHAVDVILASQVVLNGKRTVWPQQADMLMLSPASARNYEMPSLASAETTDILLFLMRQPDPSPALKQAVRDGVAWLEAHAIRDSAWEKTADGKQVVAKAGAVIWSRYYSLTTERPIFGDRDRTIHDNVQDLSAERRNGYAWYGDAPRHALEAYAKWSGK